MATWVNGASIGSQPNTTVNRLAKTQLVLNPQRSGVQFAEAVGTTRRKAVDAQGDTTALKPWRAQQMAFALSLRTTKTERIQA